MTDNGSILAFKRYKKIIEDKGVTPVDHTKIEGGDTTSLEHLLWMCNHCLTKIRDDGNGFSVDKYSRWLGFVQGCLICRKITTVDYERNITRPWLNKVV